MVLEVGNAGHHPLALLTPVQVHDGQLTRLTAITWLQPETNSSILYRKRGEGGAKEGEPAKKGKEVGRREWMGEESRKGNKVKGVKALNKMLQSTLYILVLQHLGMLGGFKTFVVYL